ncbi:MAG: 1-(5-phosphoribosyl)-5-[(5-phosphoribosylamino)methylideneamino]imidazole-4-carboxamide isomerase [Elusimicrobia bacterium]|nr:1-(5-phosphoribosyl)-5-[(5-phosphoribosylamino)methylideneamino]imidazole-4-carboxamide isomerase [Candidatus Liberimonas magnetica]
MIVIPAIDIRSGNCVRLSQGKIDAETVYSKDPVFIAKLWQAKGAKRLHIVDLDGAFGGAAKNTDILEKIRKEVTIPIEFGGGIRSMNSVDMVMDMGIDYIILGTIAIYNPDVLRAALEKYGTKVMVGIDASDNKVAIGGWKEVTTVDAIELAQKMKEMGLKEIIYTDIKKDGMLQGPNIESIRKMAKQSKLNIIASGGMSNLEDIKKIKALEKDGVSGAIIGRALYTDAINLEEAIKIGEN